MNTNSPASLIIENGPDAPAIKINDYVLIDQGASGRLSGYVENNGPGWIKIWNGPTAPVSSVTRFIPRGGQAFFHNSSSLPTTHF